MNNFDFEDDRKSFSFNVSGEEPEFRDKWFNLVGNPINGFRLLGPFASYEDAVDWQEGCDESCWTIEAESEGLY